MTTPPAAVLWDLDGTLVDSEPVHYRALADALGQVGVQASPELSTLGLGMALPDLCALAARLHGLPDQGRDLGARQLRAYARRAGELVARAEGMEAFHRLRARGARLAVVSNSDRSIVDVNLRALGLVIPGLVSVARNDVRRGKPDPEPYLRAAHLLDVPPADCLVVEDSPLGASAGLAAGMRVVAFPEAREGAPLQFPAGVRVAREGGDLAVLLGLGPARRAAGAEARG